MRCDAHYKMYKGIGKESWDNLKQNARWRKPVWVWITKQFNRHRYENFLVELKLKVEVLKYKTQQNFTKSICPSNVISIRKDCIYCIFRCTAVYLAFTPFFSFNLFITPGGQHWSELQCWYFGLCTNYCIVALQWSELQVHTLCLRLSCGRK